MKQVCLDTGVLGIYFDQESLPDKAKVLQLFTNAKKGTLEIHILKGVMIEQFYHICKIEGKHSARSKLLSLKHQFPLKLISLDDDLIAATGQLKCQTPKQLSYIDCMSIAYSLLNKIEFHTTEKKLKDIPHPVLGKLKVISYHFD